MNSNSQSSFLNRMPLWQRFALLAIFGIILVAAPLSLYIHESGKTISNTKQEIKGVTPLKTVLQALKYSQQHRGMAMIVLNGDKAAEEKLRVIQDNANKSYESINNIIKNDINDFNINEIWNSVYKDWNSTKDQVNKHQILPSESFEKHTSMISNLIRLKNFLMQEYHLSFEPQAQGFYLIDVALNQAPILTELFGQARAVGSGILTRGNVTSNERTQLLVLLDRSREHQIAITDSSESAMRLYPNLERALKAPSIAASTSAQEAITLASSEIISKLALNYPSTSYFNLFTQAIDNQYQMVEAAFGGLETVLDDRMVNLNKSRYILIAILIIVSLIAASIGLIIVRNLLRQLGGEPNYTASVLNEIAKGNLAVPVNIQPNDNSSLIYSMNQMRNNLANIVGDVRKSADSIASTSNIIAEGNINLSSRTDEQASSLQQTAATTEEITATVRQNSENADLANNLAATAAKTAAQGGSIVAELVQSMSEINEKSEEVENIINVIDSIAFQTNILALNAAVEAARAGEQGRGFAVVASEVRALAQRSASAAGEIKDLIESSVRSTAKGNEQAALTGSTMQQIVDDINRVTDIMGEISAASREQTTAIEEINTAIAQMDEVTRQNANLVEDSTNASDNMQDQANRLVKIVSTFILDQNEARRTIDVTPKTPPIVRSSNTKSLAKKTTTQKVVKSSHSLAKPNIKEIPQNTTKPKPTKTYGSQSSNIDEWTEF